MPRGDGTGPMGYGPRTGASAGRCAGLGAPGYGFGRAGRGCRRTYYETGLPGWARYGGAAVEADEQELLAREEELLEGRLKQVRERMSGRNGERIEPSEEPLKARKHRNSDKESRRRNAGFPIGRNEA